MKVKTNEPKLTQKSVKTKRILWVYNWKIQEWHIFEVSVFWKQNHKRNFQKNFLTELDVKLVGKTKIGSRRLALWNKWVRIKMMKTTWVIFSSEKEDIPLRTVNLIVLHNGVVYTSCIKGQNICGKTIKDIKGRKYQALLTQANWGKDLVSMLPVIEIGNKKMGDETI